MTTINLLNWREKHRQLENNKFFAICGLTVLVCCLVVFMIDGIITRLINADKADVEYLASEIAAVEVKIGKIKDLQKQKDLLLQRRQIIESLQENRNFVVKIFDNIARVMPKGVVLNDMTRKGDELTLVGMGDSNLAVSNLLKAVQRLRWVKDAKLTEIKLSSDPSGTQKTDAPKRASNAVNFKISITMDTPKANTTTDTASDSKSKASTDAAKKAAPATPAEPPGKGGGG